MRKMNSLTTAEDLKAYMNSLGISLPFDNVVQSSPFSPLAQPHKVNGKVIGNSFAVLPMEGFDGTTDGRPTESSHRRWQRFGLSGAKLIWGGEAVAVCPDGRGNPNQLMMIESTVESMSKLREGVVKAHAERFGTSDDFMIGIQLTHAGRLSRPHDRKRWEPRIIYHHLLLDSKIGITPDYPVMSDEEIERVINDFVKASMLSQQAGFDFVEIKCCHGFLGHEILSAVDRAGPYGGSFENRTRFLREIVSGIRNEAPDLEIAVRLSAFDFVPFQRNCEGSGEPMPFIGERYPYAFGGDGTGLGVDLTETLAFLDLLIERNIKLVSISAGASYNTHLLMPTLIPDVNGYKPPEDPLAGVARLISVTNQLKQQRPNLIYIGAAYSYLQQWLPNVAQAAVREGMVDIVGIGRMALCYPGIVTDILEGEPLKRSLLCRSCGDCRSSHILGLISGCYSLDEYYRNSPYGKELRRLKRERR